MALTGFLQRLDDGRASIFCADRQRLVHYIVAAGDVNDVTLRSAGARHVAEIEVANGVPATCFWPVNRQTSEQRRIPLRGRGRRTPAPRPCSAIDSTSSR